VVLPLVVEGARMFPITEVVGVDAADKPQNV
jgi:hypothetical protein